MSIANGIASRATQEIDETYVFGGKLEKAKFLCFPATADNLLGGVPKEIPFFLNPSSITMERQVQFQSDPALQSTTTIRYGHTDPICLSIGELWFDTYDERKSVREAYIDDLESLCDYDPLTHFPNVIVFVFGQFSQATRHKVVYTFFMSKLSVEYTMFLPDGTPVRAKVGVTLTQVMPPFVEEMVRGKQSPDHAKLYTVKRGDTLQGISNFAYDTPSEWRRIADANKIEDPMALRPGRKLMLPPILK